MKKLIENKIAVIGLGYVGLPLCVALEKFFKITGFDTNIKRIEDLKNGIDNTKEIAAKDLRKCKNINFTNENSDLQECDIYIITVPTPVNKRNNPDLYFLKIATQIVAKCLSKNNVIIYESTVYPGATEEFCVPILEKISKLNYLQDFNVGYSPERINPGDNKNKLPDIVKVVSASDKNTLKLIKNIYSLIVKAGVYSAQSIKVAEAAKVIENIQRDVNIALVNEFSLIFNKLNINTYKVLEAANTKWNFLEFYPGLVGGHCIGIDPYYLTYKSQKIGYNPKLILSGREINEKMASYICKLFFKRLFVTFRNNDALKVLVLGLSFKENCPDTRNSKVFKIIKSLNSKNVDVDVYDPHVPKENFFRDERFNFLSKIKSNEYHGIIIAVAHNEFKKIGIKKIKNFGKVNSILFDVKNLFASSKYVDLRL